MATIERGPGRTREYKAAAIERGPGHTRGCKLKT